MHRVDTEHAVTVQPGFDPPGTPGFFSRGDPPAGVSATQPGQDWCNAVQEEIVGVILAAGIALAKGDNTQLLAAIKKLFVRDKDSSTVSVTNTTTETTVYSFQLPAGVLSPDAKARITLHGDLLKNAAADLTIRCKAGSTTFATLFWSDGAFTSQATRRKVELEAWFGARGTGAAAHDASATAAVGQTGVAGEGINGGPQPRMSGHNNVAEDVDTALTFEITVEWSAASASLDFRKAYAAFEVLP